ncbi:MAG TPA: adenylate/guanylate cyclase domain-containing protein [Afifellaceae bacterium]|nr:adenylate/guanylate cyclase domain-containing protein [Afifellaceae bacterium]
MSPLLAGGTIQRLRLATGLILFSFAATHFLNTALGLWSVELMEDAQTWRLAVTRSWAGTAILLSAIIIHVTLGLVRIASRATWRMPLTQAFQILFGIAIPFLLLPHVVHTRIAHELFGFSDVYSNELGVLWPSVFWDQTILLLLVWVHGCIGIHYWLRVTNGYRRWAPFLLSVAVLIPAVSIAGFIDGARDNKEARAEGIYTERGGDISLGKDLMEIAPDDRAFLRRTGERAQWAVIGVWGLIVIAYMIRSVRRRFSDRITVRYTAGPDLTLPPGPTLLEISRMCGVPHASICGGRARCSTCRVRIIQSEEALPAPGPAERKTLERIGAPPDVRLACQIRPTVNLSVTRLIRPPDNQGRQIASATGDAEGAEHDLAVLFLDIRGFTSISEDRLPYDTVFLLNRFFSDIGEAIGSSGGWIDKYMGDGLMALFGHNQPIDQAARNALAACVGIDKALAAFNDEMATEIGAPLRIAIGLHAGPLVLGRIGHRASASLTVIGETVNVASRLEGLAKEQNVQLVVSLELLRNAAVDTGHLPVSEVTVRGTSQPIRVASVESAADAFASVRAEPGTGARTPRAPQISNIASV